MNSVRTQFSTERRTLIHQTHPHDTSSRHTWVSPAENKRLTIHQKTGIIPESPPPPSPIPTVPQYIPLSLPFLHLHHYHCSFHTTILPWVTTQPNESPCFSSYSLGSSQKQPFLKCQREYAISLHTAHQ